MGKTVYLDYAATTPVDPGVLKAMLPYFKKEFGNASSLHSFGVKAFKAMEESRKKASDFLNCAPEEVVFTGSATESDNLAIFGILRPFLEKGRKAHLITSSVEHPAVLESCRKLEELGVSVTYLPVDGEGLVSVSDVEKSLEKNTVLVSVMYANNEIGTVQPIAEIGRLLKGKNVYFHTDAVQAANYLECDVQALGADFLTLSSHKIYGPKGVGLLYVKKGTPLSPLIYGGGHEGGLRSGTENVAGIIGFGKALEQIMDPKSRVHDVKTKQLRDKVIKGVLKLVSGSELQGSRKNRLPNNINFIFPGAEGEALQTVLDQKGIAVSTGSACSSGSSEPSHVISALGVPQGKSNCSVRMTLGRYTTSREVEKLLKVLPPAVEKLRKISGYL